VILEKTWIWLCPMEFSMRRTTSPDGRKYGLSPTFQSGRNAISITLQ